MEKYDEIINLPHHVSPNRRQMSLYNRAAQFAPFAALSGHEEAIDATARDVIETWNRQDMEDDPSDTNC